MKIAYILNGNDGIPRDKDMLDLYQGFQEHCYDIKFYTAVDVVSGKIQVKKEDVFCGTINLCRLIWFQLGVKEPVVDDYPSILEKFLYRKIKKSTLSNFRKMLKFNEENGIVREYFIKPVKVKLFTGNVFNNVLQLERFKGEIGSDTQIYISDSVNFLSEYRTYVHKGKILDVKHYYGSWEFHPGDEDIKKMVEMVTPVMPISYSLDVGVTSSHQCALVECNDGYALGNYGLEAKDYATMIRDRWWEIVGYDQNINTLLGNTTNVKFN